MSEEKTAECRGCGMKLVGKPFHMGGQARHPITNALCHVSFWGGFVCSDECDRESDMRQKASIDDHYCQRFPDPDNQ